jgi:hypothetical protein
MGAALWHGFWVKVSIPLGRVYIIVEIIFSFFAVILV